MEDAGQSVPVAADEKPSENRSRRSRSRSGGDAETGRSCKRQAVEQTVQEKTCVETVSAELKKSEPEVNSQLLQATDPAPSNVPEEDLDTVEVAKSNGKSCDTALISSKPSEHCPKSLDENFQANSEKMRGPKTSRERSRSRDAHQVAHSQDAIKASSDTEAKAKNESACLQKQGETVPNPPASPVVPPVPPVPKPPVQVPKPVIPTEAQVPLVQMMRPVIPTVPQTALPERTRLVVTIPLKVRTRVDTTLGDMRQKLLSGGCLQSAGSFYIKGDNNPLEDTTKIGNLSDVRLLLSSEPSLQPWQLCLAHRTGQQLIIRANTMNDTNTNNTMSLEAMLSKNPFYKTKMCNNWVQNNGRCIRGSRCVYAHGQGDMRPPVPAAMLPHILQMQAAAMRPGMPPGMFAGMLRPGGLQATPVVAQSSEPEVVFTVDEAEEKKRAERARRFAPKEKASFEREEKDAKSKPEQPPAATPGNSCAKAQANEDNDASFQLPLPPMPPIGMLPGADGSVAMSEEEIADYLLDMQQQFIHTLDPCEGDLPPGFPMPEFPPPGAGIGLSAPGVPLPEPPVPPLTKDPPVAQDSVLDGVEQRQVTTQESVPPAPESASDAAEQPGTKARQPEDDPPPQEPVPDAADQREARSSQPDDVPPAQVSVPGEAERQEAKTSQLEDGPPAQESVPDTAEQPEAKELQRGVPPPGQETVPDDAPEQPGAKVSEPEGIASAQESTRDSADQANEKTTQPEENVVTEKEVATES